MFKETVLQQGGHEHRLGKGIISAQESAITFKTDKISDFPVYSRLSNTKNHLELRSLLADLYSAEMALVFGSGMAAMSSLVISLCKPGDVVVVQENCYGSYVSLFKKVMERYQVRAVFAPIEKWSDLKLSQVKMCIFETISNPFCVPQDIKTAVNQAQTWKALAVCDNTFASPAILNPLEQGVDIVMESATKYLNGHSDVVAGILVGKKNVLQDVELQSMFLGGFLTTAGCCQLLRGLRTLACRMPVQVENAQKLAQELKQKPYVEHVYYGASAGKIESRVLETFTKGFSGVMTIRFKKNVPLETVVPLFKWIAHVPSLGGTETSCAMPYYTTHVFMNEQEKAHLGVDKSVLRLSVGLENFKDILQDIDQAVNACALA